jgi:uncharacterized protein YndB with AHSA1/START domain
MITDKILHKEVVVNADLNEIWNAFTTTEGVKTFFASDAKVELKIGGSYEMYFDLEQPYGKKGGEDLHVLSYLPKEMLSFEWNAPPSFGELRGIKTWVVLRFQKINENETKVKLDHTGWRDGEEWQAVYDYFVRAWDIVLGRLKVRFESEPIDWNNPWYPSI